MELEKTEGANPVEYDSYITGPQGARFILYPEKGKHTEEDVKRARSWLYHNHDVVSMQVRWKMLDDKVAPPEKVPDYVIIKELNVEKGKLKAQIDELEDQIKKVPSVSRKELKKDIVKEELYTAIQQENSKLKREVARLREDVSRLVIRIHALEAKGTGVE
jgi:predicted nuclease with TOPRIM domain